MDNFRQKPVCGAILIGLPGAKTLVIAYEYDHRYGRATGYGFKIFVMTLPSLPGVGETLIKPRA